MPLPAYMLQQPTTSPIHVIQRQIARMGVDAEIVRQGNTIVLRNVDQAENDHVSVKRALRLVCSHADASRLTVEAFVPSVLAHFSTDLEETGFHLVTQTDEEDEAGAHAILRRAAR